MSIWRAIAHALRRFRLVFKNIVGMPLVGEFKDRFVVEPPKLPTDEFGKAVRIPFITEIYVSDQHQWPLDVGQLVNGVFFEDAPPIVFNVCFSCARPSLFSGGDYANPESHWFNVFFGFYEIDVPKSKWSRPFGFKSADSLEPEFDDLLKIGKSDWNYFSNYVYGVPKDECAKYDAVPGQGVKTETLQASVDIGGKRYVEGQVDGLQVVSGYVSGKDGKKLLNNNEFFSPIWRTVFGRPKKKKEYPQSFIPTRMRMRFFARHIEEHDEDLGEMAYKTFIYGGTVNLGYEGSVNLDDFLQAPDGRREQRDEDQGVQEGPQGQGRPLEEDQVALLNRSFFSDQPAVSLWPRLTP